LLLCAQAKPGAWKVPRQYCCGSRSMYIGAVDDYSTGTHALCSQISMLLRNYGAALQWSKILLRGEVTRRPFAILDGMHYMHYFCIHLFKT
jgi:hypothetical protein